jgi:predicted anti-sigma-YlaC factor YlaD
MNCKTAEKWILRSLDGRLDEPSEKALADHLRVCPSCRRIQAEYRSMLSLLREGKEPSPLPRFWERLEPRLREEERIVPLVVWEKWCLRAVPVFLALAVLAAGLFIVSPQQKAAMTQSEVLLLENVNPLTETRNILEEPHPEQRNMMLIFASLDEKPAVRR